jgi:hypothetical protein
MGNCGTPFGSHRGDVFSSTIPFTGDSNLLSMEFDEASAITFENMF